MKIVILVITLLTVIKTIYAQSDSAKFFELTSKGIVNSQDPTKDYLVVDMPGKSQVELYDIIQIRLNRMYEFPNITQSKIEGKSIQISGVAPKVVLIGRYYQNLKHTINIEFRDNKIRFHILNFTVGYLSAHTIYLQGRSGMFTSCIYDKKGRLRIERAKLDIENYFNSFIRSLLKNDDVQEKW